MAFARAFISSKHIRNNYFFVSLLLVTKEDMYIENQFQAENV